MRARSERRISALAAGLSLLLGAGCAHASTYSILYGFPNQSGGQIPFGPLIADTAGNLYGVAEAGGGGKKAGCGTEGCGAVFELSPAGSETVLYSFSLKHGEGATPSAGLTSGKSGSLYGTTLAGGNMKGNCAQFGGCGTVFRLSASGKAKFLYAFKGPAHGDGARPAATLIADSSGNLYGTTQEGGSGCAGFGCGTIFKIAPDGSETVLYAFTGTDNDESPSGGLLMDASGNLYGTTAIGGNSGCDNGSGCGTVFEITPGGTKTIIHTFAGGATDGGRPSTTLIADAAGNLYGTTQEGGNTGCTGSLGCGTVFRIAPDGSESVLYAFHGGTDGASPVSNLALDSGGNLYGVTQAGGSTCDTNGCGTVFKLTPGGAETVLHAFETSQGDGANPACGGVFMNAAGSIFGGTCSGPGLANHGTVWTLTP